MTDKLFSGRHILVVEDEMMIALLIEDTLCDLGASVAAAATIKSALGLINGQTFDVATLDLNLGGAASYPVADALVAKGVPFVFATGYGEHGLRDDYRGHPLLNKPFRPQHMVDAVTRLLRL